MDNLIALGSCGDLARPAHGEGNPQAAFKSGEQGAAPWAARTWSRGVDCEVVGPMWQRFRPVVGSEDEDRIVADAELIDGVQ